MFILVAKCERTSQVDKSERQKSMGASGLAECVGCVGVVGLQTSDIVKLSIFQTYQQPSFDQKKRKSKKMYTI